MEKAKYLPLLSSFISGQTGIEELSEAVDNRLFELRQDTEETDEERFLAGIELMICEARDGFRTKDEVDMYVRSLMTPETLEVVWDGESTPESRIILSSSNREATILVVTPVTLVPEVSDFRLQASVA